MYKINDVIKIINYKEEIEVKIKEINLDGTYNVEAKDGEILRIYKDDIIEE